MKNKKSIFNVLIIGAGNIGASYDKPDSVHVLTHAHAFCKHPGFKIIGFADNNLNKASKAAGVWGGRAGKIKDFVSKDIDVVSVAVPDNVHYEILKDILRLKFKVAFVEKPLCQTVKEALKIGELYKNIPICVNFNRRFVPEYEQIRKDINSGTYGQFIGGTGYYGKGILHNGSHMIDLLRYLLGEIRSYAGISKINDYSTKDPTVSTVLIFEKGKEFFIKGIDCSFFTIFEADLFFEKKRLTIHDSGTKIRIYDLKRNAIFPGHRNIIESRIINTSLLKSLYYGADNIFGYLIGRERIKSTFKDGYEAVRICAGITASAGL